MVLKCNVLSNLIQVHEKATNDLVDCSFPFVYNGKAYYGCTDIKMYGVPNNHIWCSTKTNSSTYEHIDGSQHWGICPDSSCLKSKCTTKIGKFPIKIWRNLIWQIHSLLLEQKKKNLIMEASIFFFKLPH